MLTKMKEKFLAIVNVILFGVIIFMGASMYEDNREMNLESKHNMTGGHYNCLENPIDPLLRKHYRMHMLWLNIDRSNNFIMIYGLHNMILL